MTRDVRWYLVGSLVLVALAGCGRSFFAQREAWRHEAEVRCLKTGTVKEGPAVAMLSPISGPGICGADFPLKVAALGDTPALGYADDPIRPPGAIGGATARRDPVVPKTPSSPQHPLDLSPPGVEAPARTVPEPGARPASRYRVPPDTGGPSTRPAITRGPLAPAEPDAGLAASRYPPRFAPNGESVPIAPSRAAPSPAASVTASVTPAATLACPVVSALDRWVTEAIQPAAHRWFGQPVVEIKQISAYSCRGMNGNPYSRISEHAFGNALDISAFVLADGHVVTIRGGWRGRPEEQGFLRDIQGAACEMFTTVLAPGSNRFHYDHIHVDLMRRDSGRRICQPDAIPGDVVAARARGRAGFAMRRPGDNAVTGAIGARSRKDRPPSRLSDARFEDDRDLPKAIPGED
jgi:hypothetical protein